MKRKLGKTTVNPLDLLLDTTSNVFGSMILIAILIALFAGNPSSDETPNPGDITRDSIERQIANARKNADALTTELSKQSSKNGEKPGARDLASIESEINSVKAQLDKAKKSQRDGAQLAIVDYGATAAGASKDAAALDQEAARVQNAIMTVDQQIAQMESRIKELQAKVKVERAKKVQRISLPRERDTDQRVFWVVFINGEVFPSKIFDAAGEATPFTAGINVIKKDEDDNLWTINRGKGYQFPLNKADLVEQVRRLPRDRYVACVVFPDSIDAFRKYEEIVHELGRDIGWQPEDQESNLVFTSKGGTRPKPQ
jgi:hypothetical protein